MKVKMNAEDILAQLQGYMIAVKRFYVLNSGAVGRNSTTYPYRLPSETVPPSLQKAIKRLVDADMQINTPFATMTQHLL